MIDSKIRWSWLYILSNLYILDSQPCHALTCLMMMTVGLQLMIALCQSRSPEPLLLPKALQSPEQSRRWSDQVPVQPEPQVELCRWFCWIVMIWAPASEGKSLVDSSRFLVLKSTWNMTMRLWRLLQRKSLAKSCNHMMICPLAHPLQPRMFVAQYGKSSHYPGFNRSWSNWEGPAEEPTTSGIFGILVWNYCRGLYWWISCCCSHSPPFCLHRAPMYQPSNIQTGREWRLKSAFPICWRLFSWLTWRCG